MSLRQKLTIYLEADLAKALDDDAHVRHLPITRAAADALRRALLDEKDEALADTVKMRLDRLEKREVVRARELAILKEALLLYVRVWLEHAPPPDEDIADAMAASAEQRFNAFLDLLSESLEPGRNLFDGAPHAHNANARSANAAANHNAEGNNGAGHNGKAAS